MMDRKLEELVNLDIDGETTDRERADLEARLAKDPQAKAYHEDLTNLADMFQRVHDVEPPAGLREEIVGSVRRRPAAQGASPSPGARAGWTAMVDALRRRLQLRSPYAFAAGVAVSGLVFAIFADTFTTRFRFDESTTPGTLIQSEHFERAVPIDAQSVDLAAVQGRVSTRADGDRLVVEVRLQSSGRVDVSLGSATGSVVAVGFSQLDPDQGRVWLREAGISIRHQGENVYYLVLRGDALAGAPLMLHVRSGDETHESVLTTQ